MHGGLAHGGGCVCGEIGTAWVYTAQQREQTILCLERKTALGSSQGEAEMLMIS